MAWQALVSAAVGAVLALAATLLGDVRRDRQQRGRDLSAERRKYSVAFTVALTETLGALRAAAARGLDETELRPAVGAAMNPTYVAREQLLLSGSASLVVTGEAAFHRLVDIRDAVRSGAGLDSVEYHDAYHAFSDALWRFRVAVREDLRQSALDPADLQRPDWTDRDRCATCAARS